MSFNWKDIASPQRSLGLIAQEVEPLIKEIVYTDESEGDNGYLSIAYTDLVPVLINAVKELNAKIEQMTADNRVQ